MTAATIEERLANLERQMEDLQKQAVPKKRIWERVGRVMSPEMLAADKAFEPFRLYIRQTGEMPPDNWKPGDPIPEPEWWGPNASSESNP